MDVNSLDVERMLLDFGQGRKYTAKAMQLMLMSMLQEGQSHGYQLIRRFAQLSCNTYVPSAGTVYPALSFCTAQGWVHVQTQGRRKLYSLTDQGLVYLQGQQDTCAYLLQSLAYRARKLVWMRQRLAESGNTDQIRAAQEQTGWLPEFVHIRHAIRHALFEQSTAGPERQRQVVDILEQALAQIRNLPKES
ncbi:MAG TPA: PadR family transcriptional regulator [Alcaligenes faecalis]|nr:PadR family transcriptional regulator [Alcaligenes faecalis]